MSYLTDKNFKAPIIIMINYNKKNNLTINEKTEKHSRTQKPSIKKMHILEQKNIITEIIRET